MLGGLLIASTGGGRLRRYTASTISNTVAPVIAGPGLTQNAHGVETVASWSTTPDALEYRWKSDGVILNGQTSVSISNPPDGDLVLEVRAQKSGVWSTWTPSNTITVYAPPSSFLFREAITANDSYFGQGTLTNKPGHSRMLVTGYTIPVGYRLSPVKSNNLNDVTSGGPAGDDLVVDEIWDSEFPNAGTSVVYGAPVLSTDDNSFFSASTPLNFTVAGTSPVPDTATSSNFSVANSPSPTGDKLAITISSVPSGVDIYRAQVQLSTNGGSTWGSTITLSNYIAGTYIVTAPAPETLTNVRIRWSNVAGDAAWSTDSVSATPGYSLSAYVTGSSGTFTFTVANDSTIEITSPDELDGTYNVTVADFASGPVNIKAPVVSGAISESSTLTSDDGAWIWDENNGSLVLTRQWTDGSDNPLSGQTALTHVVTSNDINNGLKLVTTGTNNAGARSVTVTLVAAGDSTAPVLSSPTDEADGATSATGTVTTDEAGGILYAVVTTPANAPTTGNKVKLGQGENSSPAVAAGSWPVSASGSRVVSFNGLTANTSYVITYYQEDSAENGSNVVTADGFTTAAASGFTEQAVIVPSGTFLNRSSSLVTPNTPNHIYFASGLSSVDTRQVITTLNANSNMFLGLWNYSLRQTLRTIPGDNTTTASSSPLSSIGQRWSFLSCSYLDTGIVRRQLAIWVAGAPSPVLISNSTYSGQNNLWLDTGQVRLFQNTDSSQSFQGQIVRIALWLDPTNMPTDLSDPAVWAYFLQSSTAIENPTTSVTRHGTPVLDWGGHVALATLNAGGHAGSLGSFIKTGADFSYA